ncbi:MAG TPA: hypothetical protein VL053_00710, partial [Arachidicoccus sp.]|nr:hypothetical protein [Arachidicoccus sp.]
MKKVLMQRRFLLGYSDVYNDNGSAPVHILTNIPQLAAIELISHLLHLYNVRQKDDLRFQSNRLFEWMMKTTEESKRQLLLFIQRQQNLINGQSFVLIDRRPCLDLIQYILVYANPHENSSLDANHYTILLKCLLYFNEVENKIQKKLFNWEEGQGLSKFIDYILVTQFRNIGFERFKEFQIEFLKAFYFFEFCQYNEKYSAHLTVFLNSLGLSSYKSYLWKIFDLLHKLLEAEQPTPIMYVNDKNVSDFCLQLSITCSIEKNNLDYQMMRSYPLFQVQQ